MRRPRPTGPILTILLALLPATAAASGETAAPVPVLVELFTSEGCSSCPPADRLIADLLREQPVDGVRIVGLGEHVDYWNSLGWIDRFSSPVFTRRQADYATQFRQRTVYTPQVVVDGSVELLGSDRSGLLDAIERAARAAKARVRIRTLPGESGEEARFEIEVSGLDRLGVRGRVDLMLAITESRRQSEVASGENAGRVLRHETVARALRPVAGFRLPADGPLVRTFPLAIPTEWDHETLRVVAFLQHGSSHRVLGIGTAPVFEQTEAAHDDEENQLSIESPRVRNHRPNSSSIPPSARTTIR